MPKTTTLNYFPSGPQQWFESLPIITRYWLLFSIGITFLANLNIFPVHNLLFDLKLVKNKLQLWRLLTSFWYLGPFNYRTVARIVSFCQFSRNYEMAPCNMGAGGGTADYAFVLLFGVLVILILTPLWGGVVFSGNIVFYILYLWSKENPHSEVKLFIFPMKASILPFTNLIFAMFIGDNWKDIIKGYSVAHIFYFLSRVVPEKYGKSFLSTPSFFINWFGIGEYIPPLSPVNGRYTGVGNKTWNHVSGMTQSSQNVASQIGKTGSSIWKTSRREYNWGSGGRTLGTS